LPVDRLGIRPVCLCEGASARISIYLEKSSQSKAIASRDKTGRACPRLERNRGRPHVLEHAARRPMGATRIGARVQRGDRSAFRSLFPRQAMVRSPTGSASVRATGQSPQSTEYETISCNATRHFDDLHRPRVAKLQRWLINTRIDRNRPP
jgi:hypothetical protein